MNDGVLVVYKEKGYTSRDVVNRVSKILHTKRIGHTGTLDPIATGVLVLCVEDGLKLVELLTNHDKEYVAKVRLGIETDTLDITGSVVQEELCQDITKDKIQTVLKNFIGKSRQVVPKYSAIKVNGKKLYEYARKGEEVELPVRDIEIYDLQMIGDISNNEFTIKCSVSKGTYIRSLIRDIGYALGTVATMVELVRTKSGKFMIEDAYTLEDLEKGKYQLLKIEDVLEIPKVVVEESMEKKIRNGQVIPKFFEGDMAMILDPNEKLIAIYQKKDDIYVKPYRMFL